MTVYYQTADGKIWCGELIEKYDDGSRLVKILVDGEGKKVRENQYSLVFKINKRS